MNEQSWLSNLLLPAWAQWIAQDADGSWWCYEHEPNLAATSWYENEVGLAEKLAQEEANPSWTSSLQQIKQ